MKDDLLDAFQSLTECYDQLLTEQDGKLTDEQQSYVRMMQQSAVRLPGIFEGSRNEDDLRLTLIYDCGAPFAQHLQVADIFLEGMLGDIREEQRIHFQRIQSISRELLELRASLVTAHREER